MPSSKSGLPHDREPGRLGGKIGPRIAQLMSRAMSDQMVRSAHTRSKIGAEAANEFFRQVSREKKAHLAPLLRLYQGQEGVPPELAKLLAFLSEGTGELSELIGIMGTAQALSTPMSAAIANWLAPTNQYYISQAPHSLLPAGEAAQAYVMGLAEEGWTEAEAAKQGIDTYRFGVMRRLAEQMPDLASVIELWRRGEIAEQDVVSIFDRMGFVPGWAPRLMQLKRVLITPADAALMALRGIISEDEGRNIAERNGMDHGDFDRLVLATGEPPGVMELLEAYRRGFIDQSRLERGVRQSRIRNEWMDVVEKLRFEPADTSSALRGVVQGHLSDAEGKQIAQWNGLRPEDWDWLVQTEGNPPGLMELASLWNRGVIDQDTFDQGARESHLKDKYIPALRALRHRLPAERLIITLVQHGAMTPELALAELAKLGYEPEVAKAIVEGGLNQQSAHDKQLARSDIAELYHAHAITTQKAREMLGHLGYHEANADLVLAIVDLKREHELQTKAADGIQSAYVARHITEQEASADLDKLGIPATQRDYMLALWTIERSSHHRTLTEAQVIKANTLGLLDDHDAEQRLVDMGYMLDDARILLNSEKGRSRDAP